MTPGRRGALRLLVVGMAAAWTAVGAPAVSADAGVADPAAALATKTPIKHFITLMQENHSFDNYFGTYPGADGIPEGTCMPVDPDNPGTAPCVKPFRIGNRPIQDLGHSERHFVDQFNAGKMDGFVSAFTADGITEADLAMGYYDERDIPYYWNVADNYVLFDRFFTSVKGGSLANHMFWVAGRPGNGKAETVPPEGYEMATIFDRLEEKGVSWKFYVQNYDPNINLRQAGDGDRASQVVWAPVLNFPRFLDDPKLFGKIVPLDEYFVDLERGTLPAVAYIVPSGASEHPPGSIGAGQSFVRTIVNALTRSRAWDSSALLWAYDDWGGWYDHVAPPQVDEHGYGFRTPALLVSAYAKRGHVDHTELDFTSMLKFIQENWGVSHLARRDQAANNFLSAFDFPAGPRPAQFLPATRKVVELSPPRRDVIYATYASALGLVLALAAFAAWRGRRAWRSAREGLGSWT